MNRKSRGEEEHHLRHQSQHQSRHHRPHRRQHRMEPQVERRLRHHQQLRLEMPMEAITVLQEGTCCPRLAMWPCRAINSVVPNFGLTRSGWQKSSCGRNLQESVVSHVMPCLSDSRTVRAIQRAC